MAQAPSAPATKAMPGEDTTGTEIIQRTASNPHALQRVDLMSDDEIRRAWRLASSLALSGMSKNTKQAEQAFGKLLIGRDLGISPTQAIMGIDFVEGQVQMRGTLLATFIRERDGYDYKVRELTNDKAVVEFTAYGESRGTSTFTMQDAAAAGLAGKPTYKQHPRNMLLWRALSNGVKWFIPEVMGGIAVYVEGEIEERKGLGDGIGDGEPAGLDLGPEVEAVIVRATELEYAALADRGTIEMQLGNQPPGKIVEWVKAANRELDAIPVDADIVEPSEDVVPGVTVQTPEPPDPTGDEPQTAAVAAEPGDTAGQDQLL